MRREQARTTALPFVQTSWLLLLIAIVALGMAVGAALLPALGGAAVSGVATATLGLALHQLVAARRPAASVRLGGRAASVRRRYLALAFGAILVLYTALVAGALVTSEGALWACLSWPICRPESDAALISLGHRGLAGVATLLIGLLAFRTWRLGLAPALRHAAAWAFGLLLLQNAIGLGQVLLAQSGDALPVTISRLTHLSLSVVAWGTLVVLASLAARATFPAAVGAAQPRPGASDTVLLEGRPSLLKDYVSLTKPGVISLLILTTITSMYITPAGVPELGLVLWTALGGWLMASGSHAINCYLDKDIDVNMGRTSRRPIPSGRIPAWHALALGIALGAVAFVVLVVFVNWLAALLSLAGLLYYVVIYTMWLKRSSPNNIVIGGGAGAFPPLVGWAAVTGSLSPAALLLWLIVFYWTPPHFWALALIRQKDYARAGVPMLPVVAGDEETRRQIVLYTLQMLALTALPTPLGMLGVPYLLMAAAAGAIFLHYALKLRRDGSTPAAWGLYKYSLLYLALLFAAMVIDRLVFA